MIIPADVLFPFLISKVLTIMKNNNLTSINKGALEFPFLIGKVLTKPKKPGKDPEPTVSIPYR